MPKKDYEEIFINPTIVLLFRSILKRVLIPYKWHIPPIIYTAYNGNFSFWILIKSFESVYKSVIFNKEYLVPNLTDNIYRNSHKYNTIPALY